MITYTKGNILEADAEALVNTVNTVGIMGKGVALMFKEMFPQNFKRYAAACKRGEVQVGQMYVTEREELIGPRWIINFPTKKHWRHKSKMEWIDEGLQDLKRVIIELGIRSIALPPLGSGNGGLDWRDVRHRIEEELASIDNVTIIVYEPTKKYQNVAKRKGVEKLTPARALVAELVRRYSILGLECTILEVQKLAYFLEGTIDRCDLDNPLDLRFSASKFGPYAPRLTHLLDGLDGSYLHCDKRLADAGPFDLIQFEDAKRARIDAYLKAGDAKPYQTVLDATERLIDGFQSPLGMELLATVDWLLKENVEPAVTAIKAGLKSWPGGVGAGQRKLTLFDDRLIALALERLVPEYQYSSKDAQSDFAEVLSDDQENESVTQDRRKKSKRPSDVVGNAVHIAKIATGEIEPDMDEADDGRDRAAVELGRKGGKARAEKMSAKRRKEIAQKAAAKRWKK